jgi:tRNA(Ile)-lysidine synthase TilS/MesJ
MFTRFEKILVAVSGGKDSLSLWDILINLGYQVDGIYISLGIGEKNGYSDLSRQMCEKFSRERNQELHIIDVKGEYGESIPQIAQRTRRGKNKACSVCGLTKRHLMNQVSRNYNYDVLVTGHNLDDEAAVLFGNTLH